jgi:hypothetical protein
MRETMRGMLGLHTPEDPLVGLFSLKDKATWKTPNGLTFVMMNAVRLTDDGLHTEPREPYLTAIDERNHITPLQLKANDGLFEFVFSYSGKHYGISRFRETETVQVECIEDSLIRMKRGDR